MAVRITEFKPVPSFKSFERGMVCITVMGSDMEGCQFFIMFNWFPYVDGTDTIIGKVNKGLDVVDGIQMGDRVIEESIYSR